MPNDHRPTVLTDPPPRRTIVGVRDGSPRDPRPPRVEERAAVVDVVERAGVQTSSNGRDLVFPAEHANDLAEHSRVAFARSEVDRRLHASSIFSTSMTRIAFVLFLVACKKPQPIVPEDSGVVIVDAGIDSAIDAAPDAVGDADTDACVPGDTWDAKIEIKNKWRPDIKMMLPGSLDVVVPRMGARKAIFSDCGMTGGGCGDCTKPYDSTRISCKLDPSRVKIDIGIDDQGPTWVVLEQRGNFIMADWTEEPGIGGVGTPQKHSEIAITLPCAVKIRFVR